MLLQLLTELRLHCLRQQLVPVIHSADGMRIPTSPEVQYPEIIRLKRIPRFMQSGIRHRWIIRSFTWSKTQTMMDIPSLRMLQNRLLQVHR